MQSLKPEKPQDVIGAGRAALSKYERKFKRGSLIFIEGETSTDMYIIKQGKIRILKQEGETTVELAVLGPGAVIGELALLDHQPRTATAQVVEDVSATVIDEQLLRETLARIPSWLASIIQVVVKRLRDTMKRTSDDIVRKSVAGTIRALLLMTAGSKDENPTIPLGKAKEIIYASIGLGGIESENVFLHLILKDMLLIRKNDMGEERLILKNPEALGLYMTYLRSHQHNTPLPGETLSPQAIDLASLIGEAGEKNGKRVQDKIIMIGIPQIEIELQRRGKGIRLDPNILDELIAARVMANEQTAVQGATGKQNRTMVMYNRETLRRIVLLHAWLSTFKEEVTF